MKRTTPVYLLLLLAHFLANNASAAPYGSGWYQEIQASIGYEDNVARSYRAVDDTDDVVSSVAAGIGYSSKVRENLQLVWSGYIAYNHHDEFDKLNNITTSLGLSLAYQPNTSFDSHWYESTIQVSRLDYKDNDAREGYLVTGDASINRRLGMMTTGRIGYRYTDLVFDKTAAQKNRDAAFDVARHEIFIGIDRSLSDRLSAVAEYGYQHGGFTWSVSGSPNPLFYEVASKDSAFSTCTSGGCDNWMAYRSVVDIHMIDVGLAYSLDLVNFDLSARYYRAGGSAGPNYSDWLIQIGALWNF
ncbi:MAG: hypothetical protein WD002_09395 [Pseudomonadales bacterium]